ncbi:unnamed protein product [Arabidopsis arenosa]|uniref:Uncharacterized protein n=1 Tax=Arabidopsis arenosa TaxID=38785 RepID=A0A8S1ZJ84_ARAAE|nr:unnamed protein product [Arabidopsis arenosa]
MNYDLPPPIDLRRLPWFVQQSLVNTGFCVIERPVIAHFMDHILEQVDAMPAPTYLIVFPKLAYIENEMYIGPTTRDSLFCGYHAVTIMAVGYQNGLRFAICRQNNGLAAEASGYVKVSLSVIKRDDEKDEEEEKEDRKRPRLPEKAGKGEEVRKRQRIAGKGYSQSNVVFEAAWALTNIASGASEETKAITDSGAIPLFAKLLSYSSEEVREQAVLALGYVAGDSSKCLEHVCKALMPLMGQFNEHSMLRNGAWTLSNFCRGKPQPAFEQTKAVVPESAHHPSPSVLIPALLLDIGNIVTGDDMQTQALSGLLKNTYKKSIKKETCWAISNITVEEVIQAGLTQLQIGEFQITNAACGGNHDQIKFPMRQGCIKPTRVLIQGS